MKGIISIIEYYIKVWVLVFTWTPFDMHPSKTDVDHVYGVLLEHYAPRQTAKTADPDRKFPGSQREQVRSMEAHPFTHKWTQRIHYKYIFIYHGIIQVGTIKLVIHPPDKARAPSELSKNIYLGSSLWRVSSVLSSL